MKYRDFAHLDVLPASWTDAIQEFVSSTPNFRITAANATTIRGVAGASAAQAGLSVNGLWRWRTTNHDVAHVAGGAGQYDIYAIASANSFSNTPSIDTDLTDYNWYLVSRVAGSPPTGNTPAGNPITQTMKVGETDWDGAAITAVRTMLGMNYSAQPINPIAPYAGFTPVRIRGAAGQTADLLRIEDSTGAALMRISNTGTFVGALGSPTATTAAVDTNTTQIATTAFVVGQKGSSNPLMNGSVAAGTSLRYASQDHVHPVDTSRAPLASPTLTGVPAAPTAAVDTNTTQLATTAYVIGQGYAKLSSNRILTNIANGVVVRDVGEAGIRAGRVLSAVSDFRPILSNQNPIVLFNLASTADGSGNAYNTTNKGSVPFTTGIQGTTGAAQFNNNGLQALYISTASHPTAETALRIATGSVGCWFRGAKRSTLGVVMSKTAAAAPNVGWLLTVNSNNQLQAQASYDGTNQNVAIGSAIDVVDDRWHFGVFTHDGARLRLYIDGALEGSVAANGPIFASTGPFNIGGQNADVSTSAGNAYNGRVAEAFVTDFVLTESQIRYLYAASISHGLGVVPVSATLAVTEALRGVELTTNDFPTPASATRIYNFDGPGGTPLADSGIGNVALTSSGGTQTLVAGPHGGAREAYHFTGTGTLQSTDTGLPSGTASHSYGAWFRTTSVAAGTIMGWGTAAGGLHASLSLGATGMIQGTNVAATASPANDGNWHFGCVVCDNGPADAMKEKVYLDGRLVAAGTTLNAITLAGANRFRVGSYPDGTQTFTGAISRPFVYAGALTAEQVRKVYNANQGGAYVSISPKNAGDHIEAMDAARILVVFDELTGSDLVSIELAA